MTFAPVMNETQIKNKKAEIVSFAGFHQSLRIYNIIF
jgi:hypothetical protein